MIKIEGILSVSESADFIIIAVRYDENNEYITHVKRYKRDGELLIDLKEWTRDGITNFLDEGNICVTAIKNPLSGLWEKKSLIKICSGYIYTLSDKATKDYLGELPKF